MITEADIRALLDEIVDPCSEAAGCPAGLDTMGMLPSVEVSRVEGGARVEVVVAVTEFGCLMGAPFMAAVEEKLRDLPGLSELVVRLDDRFEWSPERMRPAYRQRLEAMREGRRQCGVPMIRTDFQPKARHL